MFVEVHVRHRAATGGVVCTGFDVYRSRPATTRLTGSATHIVVRPDDYTVKPRASVRCVFECTTGGGAERADRGARTTGIRALLTIASVPDRSRASPTRHVGGTSRSVSAPIAAFVIWADTECRAHRLPGVRRPGGSTELRRCMVPRQPPSANLPIADAEWSPDGHPTPKFWETPGRARLAPPNAGSAAALNGSRSDGGWLQIRSPMLTVRFPSASSRLPTCPGRARLHPQLVMVRTSSDRTHSGLRRSGH
jgi:hypothetical protein